MKFYLGYVNTNTGKLIYYIAQFNDEESLSNVLTQVANDAQEMPLWSARDRQQRITEAWMEKYPDSEHRIIIIPLREALDIS